MKEEDKKEEEKRNKSYWFKVFAVLLFVVFAIILIIWLTRGQVTTTGQYPNDVVITSLSCTKEGDNYPIFTYDNAIKKRTKLSFVFSSEKYDSISLIQSMYYNDESHIVGSEAFSHADMNKQFSRDGLGSDALNATYARLSDRMEMSLYQKREQMTVSRAKYFLLEKSNGESLPETKSELKSFYESKGFTCTSDK